MAKKGTSPEIQEMFTVDQKVETTSFHESFMPAQQGKKERTLMNNVFVYMYSSRKTFLVSEEVMILITVILQLRKFHSSQKCFHIFRLSQIPMFPFKVSQPPPQVEIFATLEFRKIQFSVKFLYPLTK